MTTKIFVYGTLRPGEGNNNMFPPGTYYKPARIRGALHYDKGSFGLPVYVPSDEDEWVMGEIAYCNINHPKVQSILTMELGAGYNCQYAEAFDYDDFVEVLCFVWPWNEKGDRIDSGDWCRRYATRDQALAWHADTANGRDPIDRLIESLGGDTKATDLGVCDGCGKYPAVMECVGYALCDFCKPERDDEYVYDNDKHVARAAGDWEGHGYYG